MEIQPVNDDHILIRKRHDCLWLTINRPDHHNTMTIEMLRQLAAAFLSASDDKDLRAIILTGAGDRTFCAGGHLKTSESGSPFELEPEQADHPVADLFRAMEQCQVPIVGRINGSAFGGGVGLVCACDFAVTVSTASFATTEARYGLFPMMILPHLLRVVPRRQLVEMCFFAEKMPATKAREFGLVNDIVEAPQIDARVESIVEKLRSCSPTAIRLGRRALNQVTDLSVSEGLMLTQALLPIMAQSNDAKEGRQAFAERRPPSWATPQAS